MARQEPYDKQDKYTFYMVYVHLQGGNSVNNIQNSLVIHFSL